MNEDIFQTKQAQGIIKYIREGYGDELEFLWPKFSNNAIWRNKTNQKWYALLMAISGDKLGLGSNKPVEIIDLRFDKGAALDFAHSNEHVLPGYHMNKNNWITILLDDGMPFAQIMDLVDNSYKISLKSK